MYFFFITGQKPILFHFINIINERERETIKSLNFFTHMYFSLYKII